MLDFFMKSSTLSGEKEFCGSIGWKNVVWTCKIVAEWFAGILSDEDCSRVADFCHCLKWIFLSQALSVLKQSH